MKIKTYLLFSLCFFGGLIFSCQNGDSEDYDWGECPSVLPHFKINGIKSQNAKFVTNKYTRLSNLEGDVSVLWDKYALKYHLETEYIAKRKMINTNGSLMALSCIGPGYKGGEIGIDTLFIRTTSDYNESYKAGDTINEIVGVVNWSYYYYNNTDEESSMPISNYIQENKEKVLSEYFDLKLTEAPTNTEQKHSFEIIYKLNNGEIFKEMSSPVFLEK
ncbi:hypothetical protein [Wenyingzhuangia sp. IMCC45574]